MEYNDLLDDIHVILYKQRETYPKNQIEYGVRLAGNETEFLISNRYSYSSDGFESAKAVHKNIDLLIRMYCTMPDARWENLFVNILIQEVFQGDYKQLKYFFLEFLVKTLQTSLLFSCWSDFNETESLKKLGSLICYEPQYFSPEELSEIQKRIEKHLEVPLIGTPKADEKWKILDMFNEIPKVSEKRRILDMLMGMKYDSLSQRLIEKENPEINFDVKRVKEEIEYFGFPKELESILSEIQSDYTKAKTDKEYMEVIDRVRKLLDQLEDLVSKRVSQLLKKRISKGKKPGFGRRRQFLCEQGLIQKDELEMLNGLYGMASTEGTHSLKSTSECARICRNIAVEAALFLLKRLREFEADKGVSN